MGMDLSSSYILLTKEQFRELEEEKLYFKSCYTLELLNWGEALDKRKCALFDALEDALYSKSIALPVETDLEEFIEDELYSNILMEEYPITLKEFLDYQYEDLVENNLYEEEINGEPVFLIIQTRYW